VIAYNYHVPLARLMIWGSRNDVDTPLHPRVRDHRRHMILEEGYREHRRVQDVEDRLRRGMITLDEARSALGAGNYCAG
jgi:hypothetical protein